MIVVLLHDGKGVEILRGLIGAYLVDARILRISTVVICVVLRRRCAVARNRRAAGRRRRWRVESSGRADVLIVQGCVELVDEVESYSVVSAYVGND